MKFEGCYKTTTVGHETTLVCLRFELLKKAHSIERQAVFETPKSRTTTDSSNKMKTTRRGVGFVESTIEEAAQSPLLQVGEAPKIPKLPRTPRPKKDPQAVRAIRMSSRNPRFGKLSTEDKGKLVNIEIDDEEEDLQDFVEEIEPDEEMEEDIQPVRTTAKLPKYVPPRRGKAKVPKGMDAIKSTLETPLLQDVILFEGSILGRVPTMIFEDWYLADIEKFPHLETSQLMKQSKEG